MKSADLNWIAALPIGGGNVAQFYSLIEPLGFNTVIIDDDAPCTISNQNLRTFIRPKIPLEIRKLSPFHPEFGPLLRQFLTKINQEFQGLSGLYWESANFEEDRREDLLRFSKLRSELFLQEMHALETLTPFFYAIPEEAQLTELQFNALTRAALIKTPIVYPMAFIKNNPRWAFNCPSALPLISLSGSNLPFFMLDEFRKLSCKAPSGICLKIPGDLEEGSFTHAKLYICMKALINKIDPEASLYEWFQLFRPDLEPDLHWILEMEPCEVKFDVFSNSEKLSQVDLKSHVEEFIIAFKRIEKFLEGQERYVRLQFKKNAFLALLKDCLTATRQAARQALIKRQITLPPALQD